MLIDTLNNLNRSTRNTISGAMILIAAVAMYNWVITPHTTHLSAAQEYEKIVGKAEEKNANAAREVNAKTKKLDKLYEQLNEAKSGLSTADEAKEFFSNLQEVSEDAGCTVNSLNLVVKEPSLGKKKKRFESNSNIVANSAILSVSGEYKNIMTLVKKLQNHTKKIWMDSFKIETTDSDSDLLRCDMTITIYTVEEETEL